MPKAVRGCLDQARPVDSCLELAGWAADLRRGEPAEEVRVYFGERLLYAGPPNAVRTDVAKAHGRPALERAGFALALPLEWFAGADPAAVRVFGVSRGGEASELVRSRR